MFRSFVAGSWLEKLKVKNILLVACWFVSSGAEPLVWLQWLLRDTQTSAWKWIYLKWRFRFISSMQLQKLRWWIFSTVLFLNFEKLYWWLTQNLKYTKIPFFIFKKISYLQRTNCWLPGRSGVRELSEKGKEMKYTLVVKKQSWGHGEQHREYSQ